MTTVGREPPVTTVQLHTRHARPQESGVRLESTSSGGGMSKQTPTIEREVPAIWPIRRRCFHAARDVPMVRFIRIVRKERQQSPATAFNRSSRVVIIPRGARAGVVLIRGIWYLC